jgi:hypothetical protein
MAVSRLMTKASRLASHPPNGVMEALPGSHARPNAIAVVNRPLRTRCSRWHPAAGVPCSRHSLQNVRVPDAEPLIGVGGRDLWMDGAVSGVAVSG